MIESALLLVALSVLLYGLVSGRLEQTPITAPMIFVGVGLGAHYLARDALGFEVGDGALHFMAELTLILVLFTDASRIDLSKLRSDHDLPVRLLSFGLPLTTLAGLGLALLFFPELDLWEAALVAAILAPTDAALGQAVVSNPLVPVRIRQTLNVESGLNDGIALPVVLIFLSLAGMHGESVSFWGRFIALQLILGPLVGVAVGHFGARLVAGAARSGWMNHTYQQLASLGLSLLAFALAEIVGGNGFIAAFVAGLALGNTARHVSNCLVEFGESEGQFLALLVFLVFGYQILPHILAENTFRVTAYALLSLTLIRMVPSAIALTGSRVLPQTTMFLGWFGPRGLASILFALVVVEEAVLPHGELVSCLVMTTVFGSVVAHGATAYPLAKAYGEHVAGLDHHECEPERRATSEMPLRIGTRS